MLSSSTQKTRGRGRASGQVGGERSPMNQGKHSHCSDSAHPSVDLRCCYSLTSWRPGSLGLAHPSCSRQVCCPMTTIVVTDHNSPDSFGRSKAEKIPHEVLCSPPGCRVISWAGLRWTVLGGIGEPPPCTAPGCCWPVTPPSQGLADPWRPLSLCLCTALRRKAAGAEWSPR